MDWLAHLAEHALQTALPAEAQTLALPNGLAYMQSVWKEVPVHMQSYAWQTPHYRLIRYTRLFSEGRISTFHWVVYPHDAYDAPIFASDLVVMGGKLRVAVIDAMPLFPQETAYAQRWVSPFRALHAQSLALGPSFERKLSWSTRYLGEAACLITGLPAEQLGELVALWWAYWTRYRDETANLFPNPDPMRTIQVQQWHTDYNAAHRAVEDKRNPYMVYFGQELGQRYNREFLFSDTLGR